MAFKSTVLAALGQAGVWPENIPHGGHGMSDLVRGSGWTRPSFSL